MRRRGAVTPPFIAATTFARDVDYARSSPASRTAAMETQRIDKRNKCWRNSKRGSCHARPIGYRSRLNIAAEPFRGRSSRHTARDVSRPAGVGA